MDDHHHIEPLNECQKELLRLQIKLAESRSLHIREAVSDLVTKTLLATQTFDQELFQRASQLADEHPAVTHNTFNVQRDLIYQPEQVTYPDNQLQIDFAKQSS